jgi:hypothetical protein
MTSWLPVDAVADGFVLTERDAWGVWHVQTLNYALLSDDERRRETAAVVSTLRNLSGRDVHLIVAPQSVDPSGWANYQRQGASDLWRWIVDGMENEIREATSELWSKRVYLLVKLGDRPRARPRVQLERAFGVVDREVKEAEWDKWEMRRLQLEASLSRSPLGTTLASADDIVWLYQRAFTRHQIDPVAPLSKVRWGRGELQALCDGEVDRPTRWRYVRIGDDRGDTLVRWHTCVAFRDNVADVGGEWMHALDALAFPVEWSIRARLTPHGEVLDRANKKRKVIRDEMENQAKTGNHVSSELMQSDSDATALVDSLPQMQEPFAYGHIRFAVWADDDKMLDFRSVQACDVLRAIGVQAVASGGDQWGHFVEALPGMQTYRPLHVPAPHLLYQPLSMYGKAGVRAASGVGDNMGPYIATTATVGARTPVFFDPFFAPQRNIAPGINIVGESGNGKTFLSKLLAVHAAARGAAVLIVDPKNEFTEVATLFSDAEVITIGADTHTGAFDPYRIAPHDPTLAQSVIMTALPGKPSGDLANEILAACQATVYDTHPSLSAVAKQLQVAGDASRRAAGRALEAIASTSLGKLLFARGDTEPFKFSRRLYVIQFQGMDLPDVDVDRADWTLSNTVSVAVMIVVAHAIGNVMKALPRAWRKVVLMDEAHSFMSVPAARRLPGDLSRLARSYNTVPIFVSQHADDIESGQLPTRFVFGAHDRYQAERSAALLDCDVAQTAPEIQSLGNGQCIFSDPYGGRDFIQVDAVFDEFKQAFDTTPAAVAEPEEALV